MYHKTCMYAEGCSTIASFGSKDEGLAKYCAAHKHAGHVLVYVCSAFLFSVGARVCCAGLLLSFQQACLLSLHPCAASVRGAFSRPVAYTIAY